MASLKKEKFQLPNLKSAFKSIRKDKKRHARNQKIDTELKSLAKKFTMALAAKKAEEAKKLGAALVLKLDKARSKGIIHRNTASRKRARILTKLSKLK
jgi:small subunit ribosomal protein S20